MHIDWTTVSHWWQLIVGIYIWPFLNTNFVSALVPSIVGLLLTKRVAEVAQTNRDAQAVQSAEASTARLEKATQDATDKEALNQPEAEVVALNEVFPELSGKFDKIRTQLEQLISRLDGRRKRKYENLTRYDYSPIVLLLSRDGKIAEEEADELVELFAEWRPYSKRKPTNIPKRLVEQINAFDSKRILNPQAQE